MNERNELIELNEIKERNKVKCEEAVRASKQSFVVALK